MYGTDISASVTGSSLASTGLAVGSWILLVLGGIFVVAGVFMLLKRNSSNRP